MGNRIKGRGRRLPVDDQKEVKGSPVLKSLIYLDNAATSWPKPAGMLSEMIRFQESVGANPGRSGHRLSVEAARIVYDTREKIAEMFGLSDPMRVVFANNATASINLAFSGILKSGDHVITSSMEHNSVMRPLRYMENNGIELTVVKCDKEGLFDVSEMEKSIKNNTRLVVVNHGSNVCGSFAPIADIGAITGEREILFMIDAAQTAGCVSIDMNEDSIDLVAFTGHKALMGPQGTGGLAIGERVDIKSLNPLIRGGTGSKSESEEHPLFLPDKYESGTPNTIGIAGLGAGLDFIRSVGVERIREHELLLTERLIAGLSSLEGVVVYGPKSTQKRNANVSFNINKMPPSDVGFALDERYSILCRVGLHCAPSAHDTIGTFPTGTVRLSIGFFNKEQDVDAAVEAVGEIARGN